MKASAQTDEEESASKTPTAEPLRLKAKRVTAENFKPFGQVSLQRPRSLVALARVQHLNSVPARRMQLVEPGEDGSVFGPDDAQLVLTNGCGIAALYRPGQAAERFRKDRLKQRPTCLFPRAIYPLARRASTSCA